MKIILDMNKQLCKISFLLILFISVSYNLNAKKTKLAAGIYATINTTKGALTFKIEYERFPLPSTVFIGLAEGTLENKLVPLGTKYYDHLQINTINKDKFILFGDLSVYKKQAVGFYFNDQIDSNYLHVMAGMIGMANDGPNTNSSQFYVTKKPMQNLDYKYTIFGSLISGFDILYLLTPTDSVKTITINRIGKNAKAFVCNQTTFMQYQIEQFNKAELAKKIFLQSFTDSIYKYFPNTKSYPSGLKINTLKEGTGDNPCEKCKIELRYVAKFENGVIFDQTDSLQTVKTQLGLGTLKRGLEEGILKMKTGEKAILFIPYPLAYGELGYKERIPPRTNIIYEIELVSIIKD